MRCAYILWAVFIIDILLALGVGIYGMITSPTLVALILSMIGISGVCGLAVAGFSVYFCMPKEVEAEAPASGSLPLTSEPV
jgi:hypothetical protein